MIKTLKNISKEDQLVTTINWKEVVKAWATFETKKAEELLRAYKYLFEEVKEEVKEPKEEAEKTTKKFNTKK